MSEDTRSDEQDERADDVEAHGTRNVVAGGLAAAALIGGGAVAYNLADDDPNERSQAALVEKESAETGDLKAADRDGDGYLTAVELAHEGFKWSTEELKEPVHPAALSLVGWKHGPDLIGDDGFMIKGESIMLKAGVSEDLDKLLESGAAQEWSDKVRGLDKEGDGYAVHEELDAAGYKYDLSQLEEAGYKIAPEELAKAGYKLPLHVLGEDGFMIEGESIMIKVGVDAELDGLLRKD